MPSEGKNCPKCGGKMFTDEAQAKKYLEEMLRSDELGLGAPNEYFWAHEMFTGEVELEDDDLMEYLGGGE